MLNNILEFGDFLNEADSKKIKLQNGQEISVGPNNQGTIIGSGGRVSDQPNIKPLKLKDSGGTVSDQPNIKPLKLKDPIKEYSIKIGDRNPKNRNMIKNYQIRINSILPAADRIDADGLYGPKTKEAIKKVSAILNKKNPNILISNGDELPISLMNAIDINAPKTGKNLSTETVKKQNSESDDALIYNGNYLKFIRNGSTIKSWKGCSGRTYYNWYISPEIWGKRYSMSPKAWAKIKGEGPIPEGNYTLGKTQHRPSDNKWKTDADFVKDTLSKITVNVLTDNIADSQLFKDNTAFSQVSWGDYRWKIIPDQNTDTLGRAGFYLHGGSIPGSIGCIDLSTEIDSFASFYNNYLKDNDNIPIKLVVDYSTYDNNISIDVASQPYKMNLKTMEDDDMWYATTNQEIKNYIEKSDMNINVDILDKRKLV